MGMFNHVITVFKCQVPIRSTSDFSSLVERRRRSSLPFLFSAGFIFGILIHVQVTWAFRLGSK